MNNKSAAPKSGKPRLVSGITPSGNLTLGNYIGAIKNFVKLQAEYELFVFVADLHAITSAFEPKTLAANVRSIYALYIACGLDPEKGTIFVQSHVPAHAQMGHILLCHTSVGELSRMTQYKEKADKDNIRTGLLTYPTLMAADILLYDPVVVPVGADQKQHLELTRNIANRVNNKYKQELFKEPAPFIPAQGARIMSLTDPSKKMSKSDKDHNSYVALTDAPQIAVKKILRAVTDSEDRIAYDPEKKPGVSNLLTIYAELKNMSVKDAEGECRGMTYKQFKTSLADLVAAFLTALQEKYGALINGAVIDKLMATNAAKAAKIADAKLAMVQKVMGIGG